MTDSYMLSATSQYALRALVRLAAEPEGAAVLGRDLARECEIPANYLSKILWQLRNVNSERRRVKLFRAILSHLNLLNKEAGKSFIRGVRKVI